ncbi:MAG: hypothetical protein OHK0013_11380 [Sandaracinaceae bacterium]
MEAFVEIIREDGSLERTRIEGDQITIGRSPTAGIPLPDLRDLEPEHLLVAPRGEGCWVAVNQEAKQQAKINGQPFQHGMVAWGTELELAGIKIRVTDKLPKEVKSDKQSSPIVLLGGVATVLILLWSLSGESGPGLETRPPAEPVQLFATPEACPASGVAVLRQADLFAEIALAKSERYPFDPSDGVESVRLYRRSQACFQVAGVADAAAEMQREADFMERRVTEDYSAHRLRLERALAHQRFEDALFETEAILAILRREDQANPYIQWLIRTKRHLELLVAPGRAAAAAS